jgi:prepilin signal peptidase PulO-like enzyme (type II secretory pathway)
MDSDNIYWYFSTSAQSIAAFIGFLTAGFYFVQDKYDILRSSDETLEPIIKEIKHNNFVKLKVLCLLTGASIIFSIALVLLNKYTIPYFTVYVVIASFVNLITIVWAISFIISIINPDKIERTATKLIKENEDLNAKDTSSSMKIGEFLEKFIKLENLVRNSFSRLGYELQLGKSDKPPTRLHDQFNLLLQLELIDLQTLSDLNELNRIRNLAAHGQIDRVDQKYAIMLDDLILKLEGLKR